MATPKDSCADHIRAAGSAIRAIAMERTWGVGRLRLTIAEIGHLIEALGPTVLEAKRAFPGAMLGAIRASAVEEAPGDEIPF